MSASGAFDDRASVGRRIGQARRESGLTQGELATRIGIPLGILDRYETGRADPSDKLGRISEVTGKPVSWFTAPERTDGGADAFLAEVGRRIAETRGQRGMTRRELASEVGLPLGKIERFESGAEDPAGFAERMATALGEPSSWLDTEDVSARADELGDSYRRLWDERSELAQRLEELTAQLAEEQRQAAANGEETQRLASAHQARADLLDQSRSELAKARTEVEHLTERVSELEAELRTAEERAATQAGRLDLAEAESERRREHERLVTEQLELRRVELDVRSAELETREGAVADTERALGARARALDDVEVRAAEVARREEAARMRESGLEHRAGALAELASRLGKLPSAAGDMDDGRHPRRDEHLLMAAANGYKLIARWGPAPEPGEIVELDEGRYRCMRIGTSPFLGDDRPCAVLEPFNGGSTP
jgi:transcriptional regulator with XRE-family HTH domain